ncbi:MAG: 2-oxoacid:ferredoxin oxidoreductase subunit beta [Deltaproteobacteria bacterium]|nr:2-oxoacid:ferredoxin oxidoreductase subunit beta [Deltaproteobacteria bacterium]
MLDFPITTFNKDVPLTKKDFSSSSEVRWCPGCGDYAILATMQRFFPELNIPRENLVMVSGIGCAARFPYYMETYGMHTVHGRAPAIATGLKLVRPELEVWVISGDGDSLSIGGNHTMHALRRNVNINIMLFNNEIYGLTKGQYSPASEKGKITKSSPFGSIDQPVNPAAFALGSGSAFFARTLDSNPKHMLEIFRRAHAHEGACYIEILQNCVVFNDGAHAAASEKKTRAQNTLTLTHGEPMLYDDGKKGIGIDEETRMPLVLDLEADASLKEKVLVHNEKDESGILAWTLAQMKHPDFPVPLGVFKAVEMPAYDTELVQSTEKLTNAKHKSLQDVFEAGDVWDVE